MSKTKQDKQSYYIIASRCDLKLNKIITTLTESNGADNFNFVASFELPIEKTQLSNIKKTTLYNFQTTEFDEIYHYVLTTTLTSIHSILKENMVDLKDIDFVCFEPVRFGMHFELDISKQLHSQLKLPVISHSNQQNLDFFKALSINNEPVLNLESTFEIFNFKNQTVEKIELIGFSLLESIAQYYNIEQNQISINIYKGQINEGILSKLGELDENSDLEKSILQTIIFANITPEDKLKTAFYIIKQLLHETLQHYKTDSIILIGRNEFLLEVNEDLKELFDMVIFLNNNEQRQNTLLNEQLAFVSATKYAGLNNDNNGVKIS